MQDLRDALRALRATPTLTAAAVLSLALGIGANTAIFSLVDGLLLRSLPVQAPERLAHLDDGSWTNPVWEEIRARQHAIFDGAAAWSASRFDLSDGGIARFVDGLYVSGEFFDVLGVPAILGRTFTSADDARGGGPDGPVAVISHRYWQQQYGGAADAIGRSLTLNRVAFTIIGVTPPGFNGPNVGRAFDVAVPIAAYPLITRRADALDLRSFWWIEVLVRLKPGQTLEAATTALRGVQPQIREATMPADWREDERNQYLSQAFTLVPGARGASFLRDRYEQPLLTLMAVVGLVLLIACANVANLLLARATARRHELSIRVALGASRLRIARQLLTESLVLAASGAALGALLARWFSGLVVRQLSTTRSPVYLELGLDGRMLLFTAAVAAVTALLFGTLPALRAARAQPGDALKEQGRSLAGDRRRGFGSPLVVGQVALSLMLVVAAGLFVRTFQTLATRNLGFDSGPVLVVSLDAQRSGAPSEARADVYVRATEAVQAVPGVARAAFSAVTPVSGMRWNNLFEFPHLPSLDRRDRSVNMNFVTPGFFETYGTPLVAGRDIATTDRAGTPPVAVVNQAFVAKYYKDLEPLGQRVVSPAGPEEPAEQITIVGVVGNAVYQSVKEEPPPTMYRPLVQHTRAPPFGSVSLRAASGSPALLTRSVADAIASVDRDLALVFQPLDVQVRSSLAQERTVALLSGVFGVLAVLLAGIGLYGITAYAVSRRRAEIGIRMALGADGGGVVRMILWRVVALVGLGVALGAAGSLWASRFVGSLLYGVEPGDPATLAGAALVLLVIGGVAGWVPARRAARIDPAEVLREG